MAGIIESLRDLEFSSSEDADMQAAGFPFNVPDELTAEEGEALERIMAQGPPEWVKERRRQLESARNVGDDNITNADVGRESAE